MKLLMISGDRSILQGKKGAFWYTLEEFSKHWERVDVICPRAGGENSKHQIPKEFQAPNSKGLFGNVFFHPSPRSLLFQPKWIVKKGKELIKEHAHDVMSVHEYPPFYNGVGAEWLSRRMKIPYALEIHHIVGYPRASSFAESVGRVLSHLFLPHDAMGAKAVRCVNRQVIDVLEKWGTPRDKLFVIPSFYLDRDTLMSSRVVPSSHVPERGARLVHGVPRDVSRDDTVMENYDVVCCGRLVKNKGFADVIRAVSLLDDVKLLIIGDGPEKKKLEKLASKLKIVDRVTFAGWQKEQKDVYQLIKSAKIFVMNSLSEGGPRVALEAMALGLPVISTRVGVMMDVIRDGENGIFTSGKPADLSDKIKKLLDYPALCENMGNSAKKVLDRFERGELIEKYAEFLKKMVK